MIKRISWPDVLLGLIAAAFLCALLAFAYLGHFTRYMADDYCYAATFRAAGFLKPQINSYMHWTGRFSFAFVLGIATLIGPAIVSLLPLLALACWLSSAVWSMYQIALIAQWPRPFLAALVIAELIVFATLNSAHNIVQSFYWQTGMITYTSPLVLLTFYVGLVGYGTRRRLLNLPVWWLLILSVGLTFFAGGFSETYVVLQTCGLLLAVIACFRFARKWRAALRFIVAGFAGSLVSMCVVVLAPGNKIRQSFYPPPPGLVALTKLTLYYVFHFVAHTVYYSPLTTMLMVLVPALIGGHLYRARPAGRTERNPRQFETLLILLPAITFFLVFICFVPGVYATSDDPAWRTRIIPLFIFVCGVAFWGWLAGIVLSQRIAVHLRTRSWVLVTSFVVVTTLTILSPLLTIRHTLELAPAARAAATTWDETDRAIHAAKAQGLMDLTVPALDNVESQLGAPSDELNVAHDAQNWKNKCIASYYGVNSIRAR